MRSERLALLFGISVAAAAFLTPSGAAAQIVNVQPLISESDQGKEGASLALEGTADVRRGNTSLLTLSGSVIGRYRTGRHLAFILARGEFGQSNDVPLASKDLEHVRYRVSVVGPLSAEAFVQHDRDAFRRLSLRALLGAGPRLQLVWWDGFEAALGASYMLEYEELARGDQPDAGANALDHRLSTYLILTTRIAAALTFGFTAYVQPRWDEITDVRVLSESSLLAKATDHLSLKLTLVSAFDSRPPVDVLRLDTTLKGALQASF
jgi:hypothetical protein